MVSDWILKDDWLPTDERKSYDLREAYLTVGRDDRGDSAVGV